MDIFVSGGCKNGKSYYAQKLARDLSLGKGAPLYYLATMDAADEEDEERIRRHRREREGWGFKTIEKPRDLESCLDLVDPKGVVLLDSVTALLANEMFPPEKEGDIWQPDLSAPKRVERDLLSFAGSVGHTVFVSDYIYGESCRYGKLTEEYRKGLAFIDGALAKRCSRVVEVSIGCIRVWK